MEDVEALVGALNERSWRLYEFDEVRRVANEILGRLPVSLGFPRIEKVLVSYLSGGESSSSSSSPETQHLPDVFKAKGAMLALCHSIATQAQQLSASNACSDCACSALVAALRLLFCILLRPAPTEGGQPSELYNLQRGAVDALSFVVEAAMASTAMHESAAHAPFHVLGKRSAPLIEDLTVPVPSLQQFEDGGHHEGRSGFGAVTCDVAMSLLRHIVVQEGALDSEWSTLLPAALPFSSPASVGGSDIERLQLLQKHASELDPSDEAILLPFRICAANAFIACAQRADPTTLPLLSHVVLQDFLAFVARPTEALHPSPVSAAVLQFFCLLLLRAGASPEEELDGRKIAALFEAGARAISSQKLQIRLVGLKLMTALVGKVPSLFSVLPNGISASRQLRQELETILTATRSVDGANGEARNGGHGDGGALANCKAIAESLYDALYTVGDGDVEGLRL